MKKSYFSWPLLVIMCLCLAVFGQVTSVFAEQEKTDVGISFSQFVEPENSTSPIYNVELPKTPPSNGILPHLGQMMTSFILLLLGVACLIVFLGVISLRKVYSIHV